MDNREDRKINEALLKGTDEAIEMKDIVWKNIERELGLNGGKVIDMKAKKKDNRGFFKYGSMVAAALAIVIFSNTEYGHATANKIREIFAPNKIVEEQIEGTDEKNEATLQESSAKYIIYIDEERYTMRSENGKDIISPKFKGENVPEVFMEIEQIKGKKPEAVASEIESTLKEKYTRVENKGHITEPINSLLISAYRGSKWNDTVIRYYFIDNKEGGTFVIKQQYFLEAAEGHGARFENMLKEFKIVEG
jgi:hypothetical protein